MTTKAEERLLTEPKTSAGRFMRRGLMQLLGWDSDAAANAVTGIEAEASAAVLAELRAKVEGLPQHAPCVSMDTGPTLDRAAVLALIDEAGTR